MSNPAILFVFCLLAFAAACSCSSSPGDTNISSPEIAKRVTSIPFPTAEAERYSVEILVTSGGIERRYIAARDGSKQRIEFDPETDHHKIMIKNERTFIIDPNKKLYAEIASGSSQKFPAEFISDLTQQLLTAKIDTKYELVRTENNIDIYRAVINESSTSETLIYIDKDLLMPVKTEFYTVSGENRELRHTSQMRNFNTNVDEQMFVPPADLRKATFDIVNRQDLGK